MQDFEVGTRFGRIEVLGAPIRRHEFLRYYPCRCDCGKEKMVYHNHLALGKTQSCGCLQKEIAANYSRTHDESGTQLYSVWQGMKSRCENHRSKHYRRYGKRGIIVCSEWQHYPTFANWARTHGYDPKLTIERTDTNGIYAPDNCCWANKTAQARNRWNRVLIIAFGDRKILTEWAEDERCKVKLRTLEKRLERGWNVEKAIAEPPQKRKEKTEVE